MSELEAAAASVGYGIGYEVASIIQAPRSGATVCRAHHRLGAKCTLHCDGNYACTHNLGACVFVK